MTSGNSIQLLKMASLRARPLPCGVRLRSNTVTTTKTTAARAMQIRLPMMKSFLSWAMIFKGPASECRHLGALEIGQTAQPDAERGAQQRQRGEYEVSAPLLTCATQVWPDIAASCLRSSDGAKKFWKPASSPPAANFMTYPAYKDSDQVGSVHYAAICKEIGESIWTRQDQEPVRLPPRLVGFMERLRNDRPGSPAHERLSTCVLPARDHRDDDDRDG